MNTNPHKIIQLKYAKRRGVDQVEVELDNGSAVALDAELAVRFQLKSGMELDEQLLESLEHEQRRLTARRRLVGYLALRKKTVREAQHYLEQLGFDEPSIESALQAAGELGLLDDADYASRYVRTQERSAGKGPNALRQELRMRGVERELVEQSVAASSEPALQRERALQLARRKAHTLRTEEPRKARRKLAQYLLRKGYDADIAREVTEELLGEEIE